MSPSIAFFDLDLTVLALNSGHRWVAHEWNAGRVTVGTALRAAWWFGLYAVGRDGLQSALEEATALYEGWPEADMQQLTEAWFDDDIRSHVRPGALAAMQRHREAGDAVVLATTSSQYVAGCAQRAFDFDDALSTVVEAIDGTLTGKLAFNAYGPGKLQAARTYAAARNVPLSRCTFYTDSFSDRALLDAVGHPAAVHPDRRLRRYAEAQGWPVLNWDA